MKAERTKEIVQELLCVTLDCGRIRLPYAVQLKLEAKEELDELERLSEIGRAIEKVFEDGYTLSLRMDTEAYPNHAFKKFFREYIDVINNIDELLMLAKEESE